MRLSDGIIVWGEGADERIIAGLYTLMASSYGARCIIVAPLAAVQRHGREEELRQICGAAALPSAAATSEEGIISCDCEFVHQVFKRDRGRQSWDRTVLASAHCLGLAFGADGGLRLGLPPCMSSRAPETN